MDLSMNSRLSLMFAAFLAGFTIGSPDGPAEMVSWTLLGLWLAAWSVAEYRRQRAAQLRSKGLH